MNALLAALSVVGSSPPWLEGAAFRRLEPPAAVREVAAGRADLALLSRPGPTGTLSATSSPRLRWVPVGVYAVRVAYRLPGTELRLDLAAACGLFSGRLRAWNAPELAALNPDVTLPKLPVLSVARLLPNAASFAFADACVRAGQWPRTWRKSNWQAHAAIRARGISQVRASLGLVGSVALLAGSETTPAGANEARLRAPGGEFVAPKPTSGLPAEALPKGPAEFLRAPTANDAYTLRGLVWAVLSTKSRTRKRALAFVSALRASGHGDGLAPP